MGEGGGQGSGGAGSAGSGGESTVRPPGRQPTIREEAAAAGLIAALKAGLQEDPEEEAERRFNMGYAAGVLGAVRFYEVLLTAKDK